MNAHRRMEAKRTRRRARNAAPAWVRDQRDEALRLAGYANWQRLGSRLRSDLPRPGVVGGRVATIGSAPHHHEEA